MLDAGGMLNIWPEGLKRPESAEEFKMLLQAQLESPMKETRARTELLHLHQRNREGCPSSWKR